MILNELVVAAKTVVEEDDDETQIAGTAYGRAFRDGVKWLLEQLYECDDLEIDVDE